MTKTKEKKKEELESARSIIKQYEEMLEAYKGTSFELVISDALENAQFWEFCISNDYGEIVEFQHYLKTKAEHDFKSRNKQMYEVITINWTFANQSKEQVDYDPTKPSPNYKEVHKNKYVMNIGQLISFICNTYSVAEDIVAINPIAEK